MNYNVQLFFQRKSIEPDNIKYITRSSRHSLINMFNGHTISTVIPIKDILQYLSANDFINISKGIIIRKNQIVHISDDGIYTMTDGRSFQGRKRSLKQHKDIRKSLMLSSYEKNDNYLAPLGLLEKCSLMDEMQLAFCVIELVFDTEGHGVDFVFRYCNKAMENVEGVPIEKMLNHSFYEIFKNGDKKWLVTYADVALNGSKHTINDFSPEINKTLTIHCYQPCEGYCACVLIPNKNPVHN